MREFCGQTQGGLPVFTDYFPAKLKDAECPDQSFVGVWKKGDNYAEIEPFWDHLGFSQMLEECLVGGTLSPSVSPNEGTSGRHIHMVEKNGRQKPIWLLSFDPHAEPAEVSAKVGYIGRQFAAMAFVAELRRLLLRKQRTTYQTQQMTLAGRVKGKLLIGPTVRRHLGRGRMDLVACAVPVRTQENRINQLFRYTLRLCKESLSTLPSTSLQTTWTWANFCDEIFSDISEIRSTRDSDYNPHGLTGFFKEHAKLLALAKVIKKNHQEPGSAGGNTTKTTPFLLNTWLVFERWVRARASKAADKSNSAWKLLRSSDCWKSLGDSFPGFLPDLVFESRSVKTLRILDVKYRRYWQEVRCTSSACNKSDYHALRHDLHQILAYKTVFGAERVGIIFPSSGTSSGTSMRTDFQCHPDSVNPALFTLPVTPENNKIDNILADFLCLLPPE